MEKITSVQNPKIKMLVELQAKSKVRRSSGLFVVEGRREIEHCLEGGYQIKSFFVCPEILGSAEVPELFVYNNPDIQCFEVTRQVYEKLAYREGTEGIIAEVHCKEHTLDGLDDAFKRQPKGQSNVQPKGQPKGTTGNPLVIVLESVEKPGNLGAILRSADAAAADAVIVCDPLTDLYNPNLLRSSIGAAFTVPVAVCTSEEAVKWLKDRDFSILTAQLQDSKLYYDTDMTGPTAIVMGTESTGLSELWRKAATAHIRIPMLGKLDSLNVSVSAAILLFEAVRQKKG